MGSQASGSFNFRCLHIGILQLLRHDLGRGDVKMRADDWTAVTRDRSLSAQFEHSIGVTSDGFEVFTLSPTGLHAPGIAL